MSAVAPPDPSQSSSTGSFSHQLAARPRNRFVVTDTFQLAPKKKSNKKKKAGKGKATEETLKVPGNGKEAGSENGDAEGDEDSGQSVAVRMTPVQFTNVTNEGLPVLTCIAEYTPRRSFPGQYQTANEWTQS